jgi:GH24 family phage-related lysozyme (muramidase)
MPIPKRTSIDLSLEELQEVVRDAERELHFGDRVARGELISLTRGSAAGSVANVLVFEETSDALPPVVLLPVPPGTREEKEAFFNKLPAQGLEIISYADVYLSGRLAEIVSCRSNADEEEPCKPAPEPRPEPNPAVEPGPAVEPQTPRPVPADPVVLPGLPVPAPEILPVPLPVPGILPVPIPVPVPLPTGTIPTIPERPAPIPTPAPEPTRCTPEFSERAISLILEFEGMDQPSRWPGGASGITIGIGYDLGYTERAQFFTDWSPHLDRAAMDRLARALGVKGQAARSLAPEFRGLAIQRPAALQVFASRTLPRYRGQALGAFPGMEKLPLDAQGALVSLVFNRGPSLKGERRREMRAIRGLISEDEWPRNREPIAQQIEAMQRLWRGQGLDGLLRRRKAEAGLVRCAC